MAADCKSAGLTPYVGSNPTPTMPGSGPWSGSRTPAGVAQLVERQPSKLRVAGSSPVARSGREVARVAQSVEHILGKDEVTGSIPVASSGRASQGAGVPLLRRADRRTTDRRSAHCPAAPLPRCPAELCRAKRSFSSAPTARTGTTSPTRTGGSIRSASSGRSTARGATSTSSTRSRSRHGDFRAGWARAGGRHRARRLGPPHRQLPGRACGPR